MPSVPAPRQLLGLLLVSAATLLLQVTWTRILSVSLWYHFAFLVVCTALLGFGLSGVLLAISRRLAALPLPRGLALASTGLSLAILVGFVGANRLPFAPFALLSDPRQLLYTPLFLLCITAPFVFSGLCVAWLFSHAPQHAGRIYFMDLLGAGLGCFAFVVVMPVVGASGAVLASATLAALATCCFAGPRGRLAAAALATLLALCAPWGERLLPIRVSPAKIGGSGQSMQALLASPHNLYSAWNTFSRVDVLPAPWGREILLDAGTAMTRLPRVSRPPEALGPIVDERRLVLVPGRTRSVLIIGSGGGWDVLAALRNRVPQIAAVEVNPLINRLVTHEMAAFVGHIFDDPAVTLHTAEARSFIRREADHYQVIMASHTISNAATASGALSLAESYVMTLEAFVDYLRHLTPDGRLWLTRPEAQLPRAVATAAEALRQQGVARPAEHLLVFASGPPPSFYGGLVVSLQPFTSADLALALKQLTDARLRILHWPERGSARPQLSIYRRLLEANPQELERLYESSLLQLRPATDERPFFNQLTRWSALSPSKIKQVFRQERRARMALEDQPVAEATLLLVLVQSGLLVVLLIVVPLLWRRRGDLHQRGAARPMLYFLGLGLGYILCEIAMIQRLTLFLGQPVHTFATVVGVLLLSSGAGSLLSTKLCPLDEQVPRRLRRLLPLVALAILIFAWATAPLLRTCLGLPLPARVAITALLLAPLGVIMGMPFPLGLRQVAPAVVPWAWGLNAVASVVGSVGAIVLATLVGFSGVFVAAAAIYGLAALAWRG